MSSLEKKSISKKNYINITPKNIQWGFHSHYIQEKDGMFSWYIPSFDIYFSSKTIDEGNDIAKAITNSFFNYWLKEKGFRKFLMKLLNLGYKTSSHDELKHLLNRTNLNAHLKGSISRMPKEFAHAESSDQDGNLAIAV